MEEVVAAFVSPSTAHGKPGRNPKHLFSRKLSPRAKNTALQATGWKSQKRKLRRWRKHAPSEEKEPLEQTHNFEDGLTAPRGARQNRLEVKARIRMIETLLL